MPIVNGRYREPDEESQLAEACPTELHEVLHAASATFWGFRVLRVSATRGETIFRLPLGPDELVESYMRNPVATRYYLRGIIAATIAPYMFPKDQLCMGEEDAASLVPWLMAWDAIQSPPGDSKPLWETLGAAARRRCQLWLARPHATAALTTLASLLFIARQWNPEQWHAQWNRDLCRPLRPTDLDYYYRVHSR